MENIDLRPKHLIRVPGLGVFTAPQAIARLFHLHDYTKCPSFNQTWRMPRILYPILRPNLLRIKSISVFIVLTLITTTGCELIDIPIPFPEDPDAHFLDTQMDPPRPLERVTVADIVSDVASGGTKYYGWLVKVEARVFLDENQLSPGRITLTTSNANVTWLVMNHPNTGALSGFRSGDTYTFVLLLMDITPPGMIQNGKSYRILSIFDSVE